MPRIVNNRICYANHNVVSELRFPTMDSMLTMAAALTPEGDAKLHHAQLKSFNNGTWTVELPTVVLTNFWDSESAERRCELPTEILAIATLHNGNYEKVIFVGHCHRSKSFQPLWQAMRKQGIRIGRSAEVEANCKYFALYDAAVAAHKANQPDPACFI